MYKIYKKDGVDAFALLLKRSLVRGNQIMSTLPHDFLVHNFKSHLQKIRNAYIPNNQIAQLHLDALAKRILLIPKAEQLFFPAFVRFGTEVNEETVFKIISKNRNLHVWPNTHYCMYFNELDFYVMQSLYTLERNINNPKMDDVPLEVFRDYLVTAEMKLDFDRISLPGNKTYQIIEDGELRYLLLVNMEEELLMVLSL